MQIFQAALGAAFVAATLAAPAARERRVDNIDIAKFTRANEPCAILIPGYDAPYCDNTIHKPGTYGIEQNIGLPLGAWTPGSPNPRTYEVRQAAKQSGAGALSMMKRCEGVHEDGKPFPTAEEWASHGQDSRFLSGNVKFKQFADKLTCSVVTGHHRSYISGPHSCAELCDLDSTCSGFSTKTPHCTLFNVPEAYFINKPSNPSDTHEYASRLLANPDQNAQKTKASKAGKGTLGPRMYFKTSMNSQDVCQATTMIGKPCVPFDGYKWGTATAIDVSAMSNGLTWGTDDTAWLGTAPAEFKAENVGADTIVAKHDPSASYSEADPDCGCEYGKWTTGIKSGDLVGYGFYEAKLKTTAVEFSNVFWMQGEDSEINILKVSEANPNTGKGTATVSYHCFNSEGSTETEESTEFEVDYADVITAGLLYTEDKIEVIVNNVVRYSKDTPSCLKDKVMKPIFSLETGNTLPSESTTADGTMTIQYLKKWSPTVPTGNEDYLCQSVYSGDSQTQKACTDTSFRGGTVASHCNHLGPYEGLAAGRHYDKGLCGLSVLRKKQHRLKPPLAYSTTDFRVRGDPSVGAAACDETDSCVALHYYPQRTTNGVLEEGYSMLMGSGTTRTDEGTQGILFLRKTAVSDNCVDDDVNDDFTKVCNEKTRSGSKFYRCPVPIAGQAGKYHFRNMPDANYLKDLGDQVNFPDLKHQYKVGATGNKVSIPGTYAECKAMVMESRAAMRTKFAADTSVAESAIPDHWLCNEFQWKAKATTDEPLAGECTPSMFSTTSTSATGQMDYAYDVWVINTHNIKI